jgi:hypothetical protein
MLQYAIEDPAMTKLAATADIARFDRFFSSLVGFCADFCGGARQGGYPQSPPTALTGRRH